MEGKVQTVLGPVDASLLGQTLVHEHLTHGLAKRTFKKPVPDFIKDVKCDFKLENLHWIRQYPCGKKCNEQNGVCLHGYPYRTNGAKEYGGNKLVQRHHEIGLELAVTAGRLNSTIQASRPLGIRCGFAGDHDAVYSWNENLEFDFCEEAVCQAVIKEMQFFKQVGGGTIVENSSIGLRSNDQHLFLKKLSEDTGVHIVAGTGFYVANCHPSSSTLTLEVEEMENIMKEDILTGIGGTNIKCGLIGEIGCSWPLHDFEKHVLQAAAGVQGQVHCPTIIHPGRDHNAPAEILRIFLEAGGRVNQTAIAHLERTIYKEDELAELAEQGCYCEFDLFGTEISHYQPAEQLDMPSDAQRIALIRYLTQQGFSNKIVISHDIHTKHRLMSYGGHGYSHILVNVVPIMLKRGLSQDDIDRFLVHNPKELLAFK